MKIRLIGTVIVKNGVAVQSIGFSRYLPIGKPEVAVKYLNQWGIDEIAMLDITQGTQPNYELLKSVSKHCFVPLSFAGNISTARHAVEVIHSGADRVIVNGHAHKNPELIDQIASKLGSQAVIVSVDYKALNDNEQRVYIHGGTQELSFSPDEAAIISEKHGAGEILLTNIDLDGSCTGYDAATASRISSNLTIPVIVSAGAGNADHFYQAIKNYGCNALAAGNFFNFIEQSVVLTKSYLHQKGCNIRLETHSQYRGFTFDLDSRIISRSSSELLSLRFRPVTKEII